MDKVRDILRRSTYKGTLRQWDVAVQQAQTTDLASLRRLRSQARQLRRRLNDVLHVAEGRLNLPKSGQEAIPRPQRSDWVLRPEFWRGPISPPGLASVENRTMLGDSLTVFHDCSEPELMIRQVKNTRGTDLAPFALRVEVFRFDGSFLSLVLDLPGSAVDGLRRNCIIQVDTEIEVEKPVEIFARLNVKYGPNTDQIVRELPLGQARASVEFDLDATNMNEKRLEHVWLDLIFEGPEMNEFHIRDLTLSRRPRADF